MSGERIFRRSCSAPFSSDYDGSISAAAAMRPVATVTVFIIIVITVAGD